MYPAVHHGGHQDHPPIGPAMTAVGSVVGMVSGFGVALLAEVDQLSSDFASGGLLVGIAAVMTAAGPTIARIVEALVEERRRDRESKESRHHLSNRVQTTDTKADVHTVLIREILTLMRADLSEMHKAIGENRAIMADMARQLGKPLPPQVGNRKFDDPRRRRKIKELLEAVDVLDPSKASSDEIMTDSSFEPAPGDGPPESNP